MERGISLVPLAVQSVTTGLYGRACVSVGDPKGRPLPAHRLGAGDQVRLHSTKGSSNADGPAEILGVYKCPRAAVCALAGLHRVSYLGTGVVPATAPCRFWSSLACV